MPLIVLNEFLSLALEKEDYEFATEVRDAIKSKEIIVINPI
jgi:protein-arginine kinase activator protein McsA